MRSLARPAVEAMDVSDDSARTFLLQKWITLRGTTTSPLVQDDEEWLDLGGFADAAFWIEVSEVTPPASNASNFLQLILETAPSCDDAYFSPTPVVAPILLGTTGTLPVRTGSPTPFVVKSCQSQSTSGLSRYVRWRIVPAVPAGSGTWDVTFRIRVVAGRSSAFVPTQLAGCALWLRADLGITLATGNINVSQWNDQSGNNNNAQQGTSTRQPAYNVRQINGQPTVFFDPSTAGSEKYMPLTNSLASLTAAHAFVVHRRLTATEGNNTKTGFWKMGTGSGTPAMPGTDGNIYDDCASTTAHNCGAPVVTLTTSQVYEVRSQTGSWANFLNGNAQFSTGTNAVGASPTPQIGGNSAFPNYYNGDWAEMILYNRILSNAERQRLIAYLNGLYALGAI